MGLVFVCVVVSVETGLRFVLCGLSCLTLLGRWDRALFFGMCLACSCVMLGVWSGRLFCGHDVWERFLSNSVISVSVF